MWWTVLWSFVRCQRGIQAVVRPYLHAHCTQHSAGSSCRCYPECSDQHHAPGEQPHTSVSSIGQTVFYNRKVNCQLEEFKENIPQFSSASYLSMEVAFSLAQTLRSHLAYAEIDACPLPSSAVWFGSGQEHRSHCCFSIERAPLVVGRRHRQNAKPSCGSERRSCDGVEHCLKIHNYSCNYRWAVDRSHDLLPLDECSAIESLIWIAQDRLFGQKKKAWLDTKWFLSLFLSLSKRKFIVFLLFCLCILVPIFMFLWGLFCVCLGAWGLFSSGLVF